MNFFPGNIQWTGTVWLACVLRKPSNIGINETPHWTLHSPFVDMTERRVKACLLGSALSHCM
jgi:hypothetical protein